MSDKEVAPSEPTQHHLPPEQVAVAMPDEHRAFYLLGNNPAKMVTLLALYSFPPGEATIGQGLSERIGEMQHGADGWTPHRTSIEAYVKDALFPLQFVEYEDPAAAATKNAFRKAIRISELGQALGMTVAGALLPVELKTLESDDEHNKRLPLQLAMGLAFSKAGRLHGAPSRFTVFESLLENPEGLSLGEVQSKTSVSRSSTASIMRQLVALEVVHKEDTYDGKRIFELSPELANLDPSTASRTLESKTILEALVRFQTEGAKRVTVRQVVDRAFAARPDLSRKRMNHLFNAWRNHPGHAGLMTPVDLRENGRALTRYTIADEYREFLDELVGVKRKLGEEGVEATAWRKDAWQFAVDMSRTGEGNPRRIATLMAPVKSATHTTQEGPGWKSTLADLIPPEGISMPDLYQRLVDQSLRPILYQSFYDGVIDMPDLGVITRPGLGDRGKAQRFVIKEHTFPDNWRDDAACKDIDSEFFYPLAGHVRVHPKVQAQVEIAKGICQDCPVRLPCLREALDDKEQHAVRGGAWFRNRSELPPELTRVILRFVHIEEGVGLALKKWLGNLHDTLAPEPKDASDE